MRKDQEQNIINHYFKGNKVRFREEPAIHPESGEELWIDGYDLLATVGISRENAHDVIIGLGSEYPYMIGRNVSFKVLAGKTIDKENPSESTIPYFSIAGAVYLTGIIGEKRFKERNPLNLN